MCLSNMHQAQLATDLYMSDYDELFMPVNHRPALPPDSRLDRTWVQLILPYATSFGIFTCPADSSLREPSETTFDQDLVPGDIYSQYYTASMRVNMGYNYLYLSPIVFRRGQWVSEPRSMNEITDPSKTMLFVDSLWSRLEDGTPVGGGNWLVVPPCRYMSFAGRRVDSFTVDGAVYTPFIGWETSDPNSAHLYGNAWPWHSGRVNLARVDGSVTSMPVEKLSAGCNLKDSWRGTISDSSEYVWDIR
ncbi:MAG TPA: hypothetical protein VHE55_03375 [Fimbriimonadaceae bacterium]|nr:hypothetical protein [Fimbriimonadaceae bacterium]